MSSRTAPSAQCPALGGSKLWICAATMAAAFLALLDITIVNICLPQIQVTYAAELDELGWVTTAYMIANVIAMPLTGFGKMRVGYRRYFAGACLVFAIGTAACASASTFSGFVVARAVQGLGGGALIPMAQAILLDRFPKEQFGLVSALFGVAALAGPMIGPSLGAQLLEYVEWPWLFRVGVPIALAAGGLVYVHLEEKPPSGDEPFDAYGFLLLAFGLGSLQFVLEEGDRRDWLESPLVVSLSIVATASLAALTVHSLRSAGRAVVDVRVFSDLRFTMASAVNLMLGVAMITGSFFNALFFSSVLDCSPLAIGSILFWANAVDFVAIPLSSVLIKYVDGRWVTAIGLAILAWSFWLNSGLRLDAGFAQVVLPAAVRSIGSSVMLVPLMQAAFIGLDPARRPGAVGIFNVLRELGASVGVAASARFVTTRSRDHALATLALVTPRDLVTFRGVDHAAIARWFEKQSAVLAFSDLYLVFAVMVVALLPCVSFLSTNAETDSETATR